ncbi:MAG: HD domain-containing protein [Alphaproteobacteria bacterium]|nr:HD domain-containing protein [Alphaproteobacteria bacterium]
MKIQWPDNFEFETDATCQTFFKPFILDELESLKAYDAVRPEDITYVFHEHARRVAENIRRVCRSLGLGEIVANNMYWAILPHDIGKRLLPPDIWDQEEKPSGNLKKLRRTHTLLGAQIVQESFPDTEHPFKDLMIEIMRYHHEQMDGNGTHGLPGAMLSAPVRLSAIVEAYDGYRIWRPHFENRDISPPGVLKRMREEKGEMLYDMTLFEAFAKMKMDDYKNGRLLGQA